MLALTLDNISFRILLFDKEYLKLFDHGAASLSKLWTKSYEKLDLFLGSSQLGLFNYFSIFISIKCDYLSIFNHSDSEIVPLIIALLFVAKELSLINCVRQFHRISTLDLLLHIASKSKPKAVGKISFYP